MPSLSHVEPTPNPHAFKFHAAEPLLTHGTLSFANAGDAEALPIAKTLFALGDVDAVLISDDFISVSGTRTANWQKVRQTVESEFKSFNAEVAGSLATDRAAVAAEQKKGQSGDALYTQINDVIDEYIRPALAGDGGGVELLGIEGKIVTIRYQGACGSCPTSTASTMNAIQGLLQDKVDPELVLQSG
ncbi:hypothetical protein BH09SUM1_BH09SUM1_22980 [soil metagenome]